MKTNCYHTRDNAGIKLTGGMLHASSHDEAAQRATTGLTVQVTPSGRAVFVNKEGHKVSLYLSVHPEHTPQGQAAIAAYWKARYAKEEAEAEANACPVCGRDCDC